MTSRVARDCVVLGSPRSGTSMVSGIVAGAGHATAVGLLEPTEANPKGFFESRAVLRINEDLLAQHVPVSLPRVGRWLTPVRLRRGQLWLARVDPGLEFKVGSALRRRMDSCLPPSPYLLKDPRFCFTLGAWWPTLGLPACVVVFRHPSETVTSILREVGRAPYLSNVEMTPGWAAEIWERSYRGVLKLEEALGQTFLFVHYEQFFRGDGVDRLGDHLGTGLTADFVDSSLHRSRPDPDRGELGEREWSLYETLCRRAGTEP